MAGASANPTITSSSRVFSRPRPACRSSSSLAPSRRMMTSSARISSALSSDNPPISRPPVNRLSGNAALREIAQPSAIAAARKSEAPMMILRRVRGVLPRREGDGDTGQL